MIKYKILSCGSNGNFQLGISNNIDKDELTLVKLIINGESTTISKFKPNKIICGGNHTFILFDNRELFSCGDNSYGQCGHLLENKQLMEFKKVPGNFWKDISCGWDFSILLNENDEIFVCGSGFKGELGLGPNILNSQLVKLKFKFPDKIFEIKSSIHHTIVRLYNNQLYGWGNCRKGQLGNQEPIIDDIESVKPRSVIWEPKLLNFNLNTFEKFALGRDFTMFLNGKEVNIFGKVNKTFYINNVIDVKAMWSSYHFLIENQGNLNIKSQGNNSHGQLYPGSHYLIKKFDIGSEHGLLLTTDNKVYAWGWGEHGNCGKRLSNSFNTEEQVTFNTLNPIYTDKYPVTLLSCGCATSWIVIQIM